MATGKNKAGELVFALRRDWIRLRVEGSPMGTWAAKAALLLFCVFWTFVISRGMWFPIQVLIVTIVTTFVWHVFIRRYWVAGLLAAATATAIMHQRGTAGMGWAGSGATSLLYKGACGLVVGFAVGLPFVPIRRMPPPNPSPIHRFVTALSWWILGCLFHFLGTVGLIFATFWIFGDLDPPNTPIGVKVDRVFNVLVPILFLGLPAFGALWGWLAARWWGIRCLLPGHCRTCDYNLTGNTSGVCPECGTEIENASKGSRSTETDSISAHTRRSEPI